MARPNLGSVLDNFTGADGAALGSGWQNDPFHGSSTAYTILSNQAKCNGGYSEEWWNTTSFANTGNGVGIGATIGGTLPTKHGAGTFDGWFFGLIQQPSHTANTVDGYQAGFFRRTGTDIFILWRYDNNVATTIIAETSLGTDLVIGDTFDMTIDTTGLITIYRNGTSIATVTDTTYFHAGESVFGEIGIGDAANLATWDDVLINQVQSGLASVTKTLNPTYNVKQQISKTLSGSYTVRFPITKTESSSYTVRKAIVKTSTSSYNVIVRVTKTLGPSYNIGAVPANTVAPSISGSPLTGQLLTADHGVWTNSPTGYTYQWQVENSPGSGTYTDIAGETGSTLQL